MEREWGFVGMRWSSLRKEGIEGERFLSMCLRIGGLGFVKK